MKKEDKYKEGREMCNACKRQLKYLQKSLTTGGRWCSRCGIWRWDNDSSHLTGGTNIGKEANHGSTSDTNQ